MRGGYLWAVRNGHAWPNVRSRDAAFRSRCYIARPGMGKTACAVADAVRAMRVGARVAGNIAIHDPLTGREALRIASWVDLMRVTRDAVIDDVPLVVVLDEVPQWCDARRWASTPQQVRNVWASRRKMKLSFVLTAQVASSVDSRLRMLVDELVVVHRPKLFQKLVLPVFFEVPVDQWVTADPEKEVAAVHQGTASPVYLPWWAWKAYDTFEGVEVLMNDEDVEKQIAELFGETFSTIMERRAVENPPVIVPWADLRGFDDSPEAS